jgi:Spy/CpxP family protein refolding chaperone
MKKLSLTLAAAILLGSISFAQTAPAAKTAPATTKTAPVAEKKDGKKKGSHKGEHRHKGEHKGEKK